MNCPEARDSFSALVDAALSAAERADLDAHLAQCPECRRELERFESTLGLLHRAERPRAPAGFVDRVLERTSPVPWHRRWLRRVFLPLSVKLPAEAAAVILVAVLAAHVVQRIPELDQATVHPGAPYPSPATPAEAPARASEFRERERVAPSDGGLSALRSTQAGPDASGAPEGRMSPRQKKEAKLGAASTSEPAAAPSSATAPATGLPPAAPAPATAESRPAAPAPATVATPPAAPAPATAVSPSAAPAPGIAVSPSAAPATAEKPPAAPAPAPAATRPASPGAPVSPPTAPAPAPTRATPAAPATAGAPPAGPAPSPARQAPSHAAPGPAPMPPPAALAVPAPADRAPAPVAAPPPAPPASPGGAGPTSTASPSAVAKSGGAAKQASEAENQVMRRAPDAVPPPPRLESTAQDLADASRDKAAAAPAPPLSARVLPRADVAGRLAVKDSMAAERDLGGILARSGGALIARRQEAGVTVVDVVVPRAAFADFSRALAGLGSWVSEGEPTELPAQIRITLRLVQ